MGKDATLRACLAAIAFSAAWTPPARACCEGPDGHSLVGFGPRGEAVVQEGLLDLMVERTSNAGPAGASASLKVLSRRPVDTAIFFNDGIEPRDSVVASVSYDGSGIPDSFIDSTSGVRLTAGDTLRNRIVLRVTMKGHPAVWMYRPECRILSTDPAPFPIADALSSLGRYLDTAWAINGQPRGIVKAKLGPVFTTSIGGPDVSYTAMPTADAWIIRYTSGSGDCPAGCINHQNTYYQVTPLGTVSLTNADALFGGGCTPLSTVGARPRKSVLGPTSRFTPEGRKIRRSSPPRSAAWIEAPRP
ncbi:MAG: hypothetical protein JF616_08820 [Fibrobacteres bacterium]|nr:hypothetical protein [Fibrobacterota bacterium]